MISRTLLVTSIAGLCMVGAGSVLTHPSKAKKDIQPIAHKGQDPVLMQAGDVIGSGTVGTGCGLELDKWIQPGDEIELVVEGIGKLKNKIGTKRKH